MIIDRRNEETLCHVSFRFDTAACWQGLHDMCGGAYGLRVGAE